MKKILFINPPAENEILSCNPEIIKKQRGSDPPLGLLYLAAYLEKQTDYQIKIIDAQVEELTYAQLQEKIKEFRPEVIGITTMTFTLIDVLKTIETAKTAFPQVKIILGGPHVHIYPEESINYPDVDFVVLGEGEKTLHQLLKNWDNPEALKQIPGLVFKQNENIINTGFQNYIENLDELPFPARHLTPYQRYSSLLAQKIPITTMFTSRGCPYQCSFCDRPNMGKKFRARSAKNVVDEMQLCQEMGIQEIFIYDDTFTVDRQRVIDICDEIIKRGLKINWDIRARVNTVDEEILRKLKRAGCARIHYGVEAGTEKILKVLNKNITLSQALTIFKLTHRCGIDTLAYFMIGSPTETKKDILTTIKFAKKLNPDFVQFTLLTPFPATKIYQMALEQKVFSTDHWREFARNPQPEFKTKYWTKELSLQELQDLITHAYKQFYLRPGYILKKLSKIKSWTELKRKTKAGLNVLLVKNV